MAIYHCSIKVGSRGSGASACGAAAYRAADKVRDHETGLTHDFQRKSGVVHDEIMLPENAPEEFHNREKLWNSAQAAERQKNGQLYREIEVALPRELTREQQKKLVRDYIRENFTSKGMCADWALHDKGDGNPHAHIMVTMRGIDKSGKWEPKRRDVYCNDRDENGKAIYNPDKPGGKEHRIPRLDQNGNQKLDKKGGRVWERVKVDTHDWNDPKNAELWRENWAKECNKYLPIGDKIDHRSFERRGIDRIPTKHEGFAARRMERRGGIARSCELNREIRRLNAARHQLELEQRGIIVSLERARIDREIRKMHEEIQAIRNYGGGKYDNLTSAKVAKDRAGTVGRTAKRRRQENLIRRADKSDARSFGRNPRRSFADIGRARYLPDMPFGGMDSQAARADLLLSDVKRDRLEVERGERMRDNAVQRSTAGRDGNRIKDIITRRKAAEKTAIKEQSKRIGVTANKISAIKQTRAVNAQISSSKQALNAGLAALRGGLDVAADQMEKMLPKDLGKLSGEAIRTVGKALDPNNLMPHNVVKSACSILQKCAELGEKGAMEYLLHNPGPMPDGIKAKWEWLSNSEKAEMLYKMALRDDMEMTGTSSIMTNYKPPAHSQERVRSLFDL